MRQFRLWSATRPHEAGIASNRGSAKPRWIRSQVLYSLPVNSREPGAPKGLACLGLRWIRWQGVSRNKARLAEAGRGLIQCEIGQHTYLIGCLDSCRYIVFNRGLNDDPFNIIRVTAKSNKKSQYNTIKIEALECDKRKIKILQCGNECSMVSVILG